MKLHRHVDRQIDGQLFYLLLSDFINFFICYLRLLFYLLLLISIVFVVAFAANEGIRHTCRCNTEKNSSPSTFPSHLSVFLYSLFSVL